VVVEIAAAGAVLWRVRDGQFEVALVHRPRYNDWSLPKGKLKPGEGLLSAALREIAEETGALGTADRRLTQVRYRVDGAPKVVDYWSVRYRQGEFDADASDGEVDELAWLEPAAAAAKLSYDLDRLVLSRWVELPPTESVVLLVRHAKAGKRSDWDGDDRLRPLDRDGQRQAQRLVTFLANFGATEVISADLVRCVATVRPFAESIGTTVRAESVFSDSRYARDPRRTFEALHQLAVPGRATVLASQGGAIPALIDDLDLTPAPPSLTTRKASVWALSFIDGNVVAADYYEDAVRRAG
jgi:8-oxo-(d)GTP phosphatase